MDKESQEVMFLHFVFSLQNAVMIQLGKIANPMTGEIEKDLAQAKATIDMLEMLKEKTKGNLSEHETKVLNNILTQLQLNYVDELDKERNKEKREGNKEGKEKKSEKNKQET
ncbi:MAG: DUF1844 domain-containing protein [Candidatus Woesearchaeota archaeon]